MSNILEKVLEDSFTLNGALAEESDETKRKLIIGEYLKQNNGISSIGDFSCSLEWFNVKNPLSLERDLKGKLVILDFFTYCCINCLHILPKLKAIEESHSVKDGLVVIGVHSAKFDNEKDSKNIMSALQRYGISHPVVNDADGIMWSTLGIPCWPTLLVLSPNGSPLFVAVGESNFPELLSFVQTALDYYRMKGLLSSHEIEMSSLAHTQGSGPLLFPGKITCCRNGDHLAIADTGHHRIIICSNKGGVQHVIGGTVAGHIDGTFSDARFNSPQGVAFLNCDTLYLADTNNNAIRKVDISSQKVSTVVSNGNLNDESKSSGDSLSSPWDLCFTPDESCLLIAAAGCHRLWGFFLRDTLWWRRKQMQAGTCVPVAGTGREENRNNAYAHAASFAQPSGICIVPDVNAVFVADSESSSIRRVDLKDGCVSAVVGGGRNPTDLFCFGDVDGNQWDVRLQHPLGVTWSPSSNGDLYVADSYNHKLKLVNIANRSCCTLLGSATPGDNMECGKVQLNEPGGLCASPCGSYLYVADTNNNSIKIICLPKDDNSEISVHKLNLKLPSGSQTAQLGIDKKIKAKINIGGGTVNWVVEFVLIDGLKFTNVPQKWQLLLPNASGWSSESTEGEISEDPLQMKVAIPPGDANSQQIVILEATLFLCNSSNTCQRNRLRLALSLEFDKDASKTVHCKMFTEVAPHKIL